MKKYKVSLNYKVERMVEADHGDGAMEKFCEWLEDEFAMTNTTLENEVFGTIRFRLVR